MHWAFGLIGKNYSLRVSTTDGRSMQNGRRDSGAERGRESGARTRPERFNCFGFKLFSALDSSPPVQPSQPRRPEGSVMAFFIGSDSAGELGEA